MKKKLVNKEVFMDVMNKIWRVNGGVEIEPIEGNIFAFYFKSKEDMQRILRGGPWNFDQAIIVFDKPTRAGEIAELQFRASSPQKRNLKNVSRMDNRNWGIFKGSGGFKTLDDSERRTSGNWRGKKTERAGLVLGEDHRGNGSDMPRKMEELRHLDIGIDNMDAEVDIINDREENMSGEGKNCGSTSIPPPKTPLVAFSGENEKLAITNGPDCGPIEIEKEKYRDVTNLQFLGRDSPTYLSKLMKDKPTKGIKDDDEPISNLKKSGKWK
ncbi:hypothetical protein EZV62_018485 [Acer yangbiense]|uniref:DUF4283 domain-containing protein n=1 Tax=Acer yangbiense TaxID=1000413 RepID=A0A5C7HLE8_9ROSI|nr:hypothetical protein EZV62_018485 [Acer yangbiense]